MARHINKIYITHTHRYIYIYIYINICEISNIYIYMYILKYWIDEDTHTLTSKLCNLSERFACPHLSVGGQLATVLSQQREAAPHRFQVLCRRKLETASKASHSTILQYPYIYVGIYIIYIYIYTYIVEYVYISKTWVNSSCQGQNSTQLGDGHGWSLKSNFTWRRPSRMSSSRKSCQSRSKVEIGNGNNKASKASSDSDSCHLGIWASRCRHWSHRSHLWLLKGEIWREDWPWPRGYPDVKKPGLPSAEGTTVSRDHHHWEMAN